MDRRLSEGEGLMRKAEMDCRKKSGNRRTRTGRKKTRWPVVIEMSVSNLAEIERDG